MKQILTFITMLLFSVTAFTQTTPITGQVRDDKGEPVPFATVKVRGSSAGVSADANGNFSVSAQRGTVLIISGAGFEESQVTVGNEPTVSVALKSQSTLNEVVVTALGIQRQAKQLGYSTTRVRSAELNQARTVNVQNGLTGKVSGLNITTVNSGVFEQTKINLRGIRSLTGNNQPLLVVDGIPTPLSFISSLNPNDIQDVNILKGASAAALYGPDGVNGVIIIRSRRGTSGKPVISLSHTTQLTRVSFLPKMQTRFGSGSGEDAFGNLEYVPFENQQYGPEFNGEMVELGPHLEDGSVQMVPYSALKKEKGKFFNTGLTLQTDVSFSTQDFYLSVQNVDVKGITPKDKYGRTSLRFNAAKEYNKFKASFNVNYIKSDYDVVDNTAYSRRFASSYNGSVYFTVLNTPMHVPITSYKDQVNNKFANYSNYYNEYFVNPYWAIDNHRIRGRTDDILGSMELNYKATDWLTATYRLGATLSFNSYKNTASPLSVTEFAASTRGQAFRNQPGSVFDGQSLASRVTSEFFLHGNRDFSDFGFTYTVGTRLRENNNKQVDIGGNNLVVPYLFNVSNRSGEPVASESNLKNRLLSVFGSVSLNYKEWANIEFVGANDWDSRLDINSNSYFYPGVNASLVLSDAIPGIKNSSFISYAKLRGSISKSANVNLGTYSLEATYSQAGGFPYGALGGFTANNIRPDEGIEPEFVNSKEVGIELGFINNRINFEATYFNQNNTNQILQVQQSSATGYPNRLANTADFVNSGIELDLRLTPLVNIGNGKFDFSINATYNDNKIKSLFPGINELVIGGTANFTQRASSSPSAFNYAIVGMPAFAFKLSDYNRDPQGRVIVDAVSGNPSVSDSLITMGRSLPLWIVGLNPSYSWKGLTVSMTWDYRGGHHAYHGIGSDMDFTGISERSARFGRKRFVFPNSVYFDGSKYVENQNVQVANGGVNFYTSGALNSSVATNYFTSAASWKLRELALTYDMPVSWLGNGKVIKKITIGAVARNLLVFLPESNEWTDPEFNYSNTGNTNGINSVFASPPSRLFGGTIVLTF